MALYQNVHSTILTNEQNSQKFTLQRLVRQRCPLIPYLYLFILDMLSYMINDSTYVIDGFCFLNGNTIYNQCFAKNMALYLKRALDNIQHTFEVLELFYATSRLLVN
uniref:Uncharacterized protein n=1 Tax=Physcomitrium patens TaxID=3218 RepID=A0A2K1J6X1_PHYPA|nr:hypothetical protein PHYPA_020381 [Physcomitrium patens]